jgi:predicted ATPase/class 3 adenylate cyclase/Tfp pilus assembly protein PilF
MHDSRALLLTDVIDSTRLAEELGDQATAALWASHDRLARDLLPAWRGREIDKTDGMLLLFDNSADAMGYAMAYQQAIAALVPPLKARAGLHVGPVTLRENSPADIARGAKPVEVDGVAKSMAARVMSVALGGQILLSAPARQVLADGGPRLQSHGHWRLKGIVEPVELFEAGNADTLFSPPPDADKAYRVVRRRDLWLPVREIRHSLPAERDGFVGRAQSLADLSRRIGAGARLVSVLGMGGTGKTRLVTRFGWTWLGDFSGIVHAVASALEVPLGKDDPVSQLGHAIAGRGPCLVILDNFEQVTRYAEETLGHWLDRAGEAQFIVTTREVLGLPGEDALSLPPLPPPDAAELFVRRAQSAHAGHRPNPEDEAAIMPLIKLLDGLPLAIELAAARVRLMPPRMLLARMSDRFKLLSSSGARHDRQATLRATLDWSWDLLAMSDKDALSQLSVFEGGFTLEAAEAVLDLSAADEAAWPADVVGSLVDKSFVRPVSDTRFSLLVSVHEYAGEHLRTEGRFTGSGPRAVQAAQLRHAAYFASLGEQRALDDACADLDNLVSACRRAVLRADAPSAVGALEGAWAALGLRGPFLVGVSLATAVCSMPGLDAGERARAERVIGSALMTAGQSVEAAEHFSAALRLARAVGDRLCECRALIGLGAVHEHAGRATEARADIDAAWALARAIGNPLLESMALNQRGTQEIGLGRVNEALTFYQQALQLARAAGDRRFEGCVLGNLGTAYTELGLMDQARDHIEAAVALARELGDRHRECNNQCNLGLLQLNQGRPDEALATSKAALAVSREIGHRLAESIILCNLGMVLETLSHRDGARSHYEAAIALARELGERRYEGQYLSYLGVLHARAIRFPQAQECLDTSEALLREMSDRFGLGLLLCGRAEANHLIGDAVAAGQVLAEATAIAADISAGPASELGMAIARVRGLIDIGTG